MLLPTIRESFGAPAYVQKIQLKVGPPCVGCRELLVGRYYPLPSVRQVLMPLGKKHLPVINFSSDTAFPRPLNLCTSTNIKPFSKPADGV